MSILKLWMKAATVEEQERMASLLGTSRNMLYQVSGGFKPVSPERAAKIERIAAGMHIDSAGRLPLIYRTDLVAACHACQFARRCLGLEIVDRFVTENEGSDLD